MRKNKSIQPKTLKPGLICWVYARDSGGDSQELSIHQQEHEIAEYANQNGLAIDRFFRDEAKSGTTRAGRDQYNLMFDLIAKDETIKPDCVIVWSLSRLGRNADECQDAEYELKRRGILIHAVKDKIPEGPYKPVMTAVIHTANEHQSRKISEDVRRAFRSLMRQGYTPGGTPPKGYIAERIPLGQKRNGETRWGRKWIPDPALRDLVVLAWELAAQGKSYKEITEATGGKLYTSQNSWTTFFGNKAYIGTGIYGDVEEPNHHDALITFELWDAVQRLRRERFKTGSAANPARKAHPSLLTGRSFCVHCGAAMVHHTPKHDRHVWDHYICGHRDRKGRQACPESKHIGAKNADAAILDFVQSRILTVDYFYQLLESVRAEFSDVDHYDREIARARSFLLDTEQRIQNLIRTLEEGRADRFISSRLQELETNHAIEQSKIKELENRRAFAQVEIAPEAMAIILQTWNQQITDARNNANLSGLKTLLCSFVDRVELGYNQAKIQYSYPLTADLTSLLPSLPVGAQDQKEPP
jgi:DNA invertase Pin-like site-specific DNA recombinase